MVNYYNPKSDPKNLPIIGANLRDHLTKIFEDNFDSTYFLYRRARLDSNNKPMKHPETLTNRSGEPVRDRPVYGQSYNGYIYDDYLVMGHFSHSQSYSIYKKQQDPGDSNIEYLSLFVEYDFLSRYTNNQLEVPSRFDLLFEVEKDLEGKLYSPLKIREQYGVLSADSYRLDKHGRVEYYRIRLVSLTKDSHLV